MWVNYPHDDSPPRQLSANKPQHPSEKKRRNIGRTLFRGFVVVMFLAAIVKIQEEHDAEEARKNAQEESRKAQASQQDNGTRPRDSQKDAGAIAKSEPPSANARKVDCLTAEQGDAEAQINLGNCYRDGIGVPQDTAEALKWYRAAARQENPEAQYNLGVCYEKRPRCSAGRPRGSLFISQSRGAGRRRSSPSHMAHGALKHGTA